MKFTLTYDVAGAPDGFFAWFLDSAREEDLYRGELAYKGYSMSGRRESDERVVRRTVFQRSLQLPSPVAKLLGANFSEAEDGTFEKADRLWTWKVTPSSLADKIRHEGHLTAEDTDAVRSRLRVELTYEAKVFGVGGLLESSMEKNLREEWDRTVAFYNRQASLA
ncbi:DUF2505 family protein [Streptomyces sp. NPDC088196]|uniref:DUF2505 family protein n=1 Tax=Streptomyces sp. NPDC088196 TaxID=3154868 RepID=UPI00344D2490